MTTAQGRTPANVIQINPPFEWMQSERCYTLLLHVAGFEKDDLKTQVDSVKRLNIAGDRNTERNKRMGFRTNFLLPADSEITGIQAKFDKGILYVTVPKQPPLTTTASNQPGQVASIKIINQQAARTCCKALVFVIALVALFLFTKYKSPNQPTIPSVQEL